MRRSATVLGLVAATVLVVGAPAAATTAARAHVGGLVHLDLDGDGEHDEGEPGRAGVAVTLRGPGAVMDAVVTGADGRFVFEQVAPGSYTIAVDPPDDLVTTGDRLGRVEVGTEDLPEVAVVGLATSVDDGPDLAVGVHSGVSPDAASATWTVGLHNLGDTSMSGPLRARLVLDGGHEVAEVDGEGWACEGAGTVVTCAHVGDLAAGAAAPALRLRTTVDGAPGTPLAVTATVRGDAGFDAAPLNDEDTAARTVSAALATGVDESAGEPPTLDETGASVGLLATAAAVGLACGAVSLWVARRR